MGDVIAKVSGQSFEAFVKSNILAPLGMASSSFIYLELDSALRTTGHVDDPARVSDVFPYNRRHAPSSTLNSSVIDMTRWMLANLNRGELEGRRILQPASYDVLWAPTVRIPDERYPGGHVGLSWFVKEIAGRRTVFHAGGDVGFRSFVLLVPDERIGVVLASNWQNTPRETLAEDILDIVLRSSPATKSGRSPTKEQR